jgi:hypothetical protein
MSRDSRNQNHTLKSSSISIKERKEGRFRFFLTDGQQLIRTGVSSEDGSSRSEPLSFGLFFGILSDDPLDRRTLPLGFDAMFLLNLEINSEAVQARNSFLVLVKTKKWRFHFYPEKCKVKKSNEYLQRICA